MRRSRRPPAARFGSAAIKDVAGLDVPPAAVATGLEVPLPGGVDDGVVVRMTAALGYSVEYDLDTLSGLTVGLARQRRRCRFDSSDQDGDLYW